MYDGGFLRKYSICDGPLKAFKTFLKGSRLLNCGFTPIIRTKFALKSLTKVTPPP